MYHPSARSCPRDGRLIRCGQNLWLRLSNRRSRREAVPAHDFGHLGPVRRPACRRPEYLKRFAEILRTDRGGRNDAQRFRVLASQIIESMNRTSRDAERLSGTNVDRSSVDGPGQDAVQTVDRFLVVVMAVGGSRQALTAADGQLKSRDAAGGVVPRYQKADDERSETDAFIGGVDGGIDGRCSHSGLLWY